MLCKGHSDGKSMSYGIGEDGNISATVTMLGEMWVGEISRSWTPSGKAEDSSLAGGSEDRDGHGESSRVQRQMDIVTPGLQGK